MWYPAMKQHRACVARWEPDGGQSDREKHLDKINVFCSQANASLNDHFKRWLSALLLPCALMSEVPFAKAISHIMLGRAFPTSFGDNVDEDPDAFVFQSVAHGDCDKVSLNSFDR